MNRRFLTQMILFALLYYLVFLTLDGLIHLLSLVPPRAVNLNSLVLILFSLSTFSPRQIFFCAGSGPVKAHPVFFNPLVTFSNCLVWGLALAGSRKLWIKVQK
jgi:hypothetical protein